VKNIVFFILLFPFCGKSQFLDNSKGNAFSEIPFFNEKFVKNNKIKSLKGTYTFKKMGDIMRETDYVFQYDFDNKGHLIQSFETNNESHKVDTTLLLYSYYKDGNLAYVRRKDHIGYYSTHYFYDSINRVIKEEYKRDIDTAGTFFVPSFERSMLLNFETIKYETNGFFEKSTVHNSYGLPFKEIISTHDSSGYLISKEEKLKFGNQRNITQFEYDENGWISNIKITNSNNSKLNQELRFKYDEFGNLSEKHIYKNNQFITDIQVIYNLKTGLISSILTRDVATNFISILRFEVVKFY
jgi:YD repeat-containing protein